MNAPAFRRTVATALPLRSCAACGLLCLLLSAPAQAQSTDLAIRHVTVVDVATGRLLPDQTVLVAGNRIRAVEPSPSIEVPAGARVVDARGRYLIPGLWDMHVHLFNQVSRRAPNVWYFPLFVANGVTGVREMWTKPADVPILADWRERAAAGALLAPRIAAAGTLVDGPGSLWPTSDRVATADEARRHVRQIRRAGLDFVKVYGNLSREAYFAIVHEARDVGLPVAGHVPMVVRAAEAAAAGQRSAEHLLQVREACSTGEGQILRERERLYAGPYTTAEDDSLWERHERIKTTTYDGDTCAAVARRLAAARMWQVPTLVNERRWYHDDPRLSDDDPRLIYVPAEERRVWQEGYGAYGVESEALAAFTYGGPAEEMAERWAVVLDVVDVLNRAAVPLLAGTDLGGPYLYPGFSLHDELALLVEAGLSPLQALQAATLNPGRFLEATDSLGTVEAGKLADLVLLEANPLQDIRHTRRIAGVVLNGRYLDREELDRLLEEAERTARGAEAAEEIRKAERQRLRALVAADVATAERLHATDFELINPVGEAFTKEEYLGAIASGQLDYRVWEPGPMRVRVFGDAAAIRYDDEAFEVFVGGERAGGGPVRHTNLYERRDGRWQIVWSQASCCADPEGDVGTSGEEARLEATSPPGSVVPNDNRTPAGTRRDGVLELRLEVRLAAWRPDADVDTAATVLAFAEEGGPARIPGPLLRVPQGTEVRVRVRNALPDSVRIGTPAPRNRGTVPTVAPGSALVVHGLRAGTMEEDTLHVPRGAVREVRFRAEKPGTYLYRGALSEAPIDAWEGRDAQLAGAIVVDPTGARPDPHERIFVIALLDILPDSAGPPPHEDIFELAINGLSWPHTERLHYQVGDTVRWRWLNASSTRHPMHLHGFHFRTLARGNGFADTTYAADAARLAVTETMEPGSTFQMEWVPARAGHWLMHCHIVAHIIPFPERDEAARGHDLHELEEHPLRGMAGLVLGIAVSDPAGEAVEPAARRRIRLLAQERRVPGDASGADAEGAPQNEVVARGFVLQDGAEPPPDSVAVPGPPLLLTRDESAAITVVNRLSEPTTVHWHGMELESVYDGVSGWSRTGARVAPLIAPGDSFVVRMTPPRAGTFIYHTHMDETEQLATGLYGPLLVLEPDQRFDPEMDRVFVIGRAVEGGRSVVAINGRRHPAPLSLRAGTTYRLRLINIDPDLTADVTLLRDDAPLRWRELAKDGADAPAGRRGERLARVRLGVGETYDVAWTPDRPGEATLRVHLPFLTEPGEATLEQGFRIERAHRRR